MTDYNQTNAAKNHQGFLRLPQVLEIIPVGKSTWWSGVKTGRFPASIKLGERSTGWRVSDINELAHKFDKGLLH